MMKLSNVMNGAQVDLRSVAFERDLLTRGQSPAQAARRLGISPQWARHLAETGQLQGVRTALGWLLDAEDVERLAAERVA